MATTLKPASLAESELAISDASDCAFARQIARREAADLGFSEQTCDEIVLAVAELASNVLKHGIAGRLCMRAVGRNDRRGFEVEARDSGPGMPEVEASFADGYSTSGSLGYGLGTINRLMDEIDVQSAPASGTRIVCRRWLKPALAPGFGPRWDIGVFTRSRDGLPDNGDAFVVKEWDGHLLVALIDGLGHGELAQKAALAAQLYVESHYDLPFERIFEGAHRACRGTRGAVMALARFLSPRQAEFASLGNVEARAWTADARLFFLVRRGILGAGNLTVHVQRLEWNEEWMLVLHSDGVAAHWHWSDFPGIGKERAQDVAATLMRRLATKRDDATVLVARVKRP